MAQAQRRAHSSGRRVRARATSLKSPQRKAHLLPRSEKGWKSHQPGSLPGPTDRHSLPPTRWWPLGNNVLTQVQQGRDNWTRTEPRGRPRWESAPQTGGSGQGNPTRSIGLCPTQVYGQIHLKQQEMQSLSRKSQSTAKALRRHNKDRLGGPIVAQHE